MSNSTVSSTSLDPSSSSASLSSAEASISSSIASSVSSEILSNAQSTVFTTSTASSVPPTTELFTSTVTQSSTEGGSTQSPIVVTVTSINNPQTTAAPTTGTSATSSTATSTTSSPTSLANNGAGGTATENEGLTTAGKTAIAVVVPVVVVALLVLAALLFWRKRKANKAAEEQRRKEVEDYGFNPNNDPTLPVPVGESPEMTEDHNSGYRGWGAAGSSNRKASTTLSGGHTHGLSDAGSQQPYGSASLHGAPSDQHSDNPLVNRNDMSNDELGALGAAPVAGAAVGAGAVRRGPSNASSRYSNGGRSEGSDEHVPQMPPLSQSYDQYSAPTNGFGYSQSGPYGDGSYGGNVQTGEAGMPVVRDVSARRNTRIQQAGTYQQQSGIAQNF